MENSSNLDKMLKQIKDYFIIEDLRVIEVMKTCGCVDFNSISALSEMDFINKNCNDFYQWKAKSPILPGHKVTLQCIGEDVRKMGKENFNRIFKKSAGNSEQDGGKRALVGVFLLFLWDQVGRRLFPDVLKKVACLIKMYGGNLLYEFIQANLPLPSLSSVNSYLQDCENAQEGILQVIYKHFSKYHLQKDYSLP